MFDSRETFAESLGGSRYRIHWRAQDVEEAPRARVVEIFAGDHPDEIDFEVLLAANRSGSCEIERSGARRAYFALRCEEGDVHITSTRHLALEGVSNFRDIGGYQGRDASGRPRQIRWGRIFRAGHFNTTTPDDRAHLEEIGVERVFDLRVPEEREKRPSRFGEDHELEVVEIDVDPGSSVGFRELWSSGEFRADSMASMMQDLNRMLAREHQDAYRRLFDGLIADKSAASVIHCASGKDRTGFGVALVLVALGVDRETILHDYELTNRFLVFGKEFERALRDFGGFDPERITPDMLRPMYEARREYLCAAFAEIDERFGGEEAYLRNELDLGDDELFRLRENYLG